MKKNNLIVSLVASVVFMSMTASTTLAYDKNPSFKLSKLNKYTEVNTDGKKQMAMSLKKKT